MTEGLKRAGANIASRAALVQGIEALGSQNFVALS
jgi:hypothetical protein